MVGGWLAEPRLEHVMYLVYTIDYLDTKVWDSAF